MLKRFYAVTREGHYWNFVLSFWNHNLTEQCLVMDYDKAKEVIDDSGYFAAKVEAYTLIKG